MALINDIDNSKEFSNNYYHDINIDTSVNNHFIPILLCNFDKQNKINEQMYSRNIPDKQCITDPLLSHRPSYTGNCITPKNKVLPKIQDPKLVKCCEPLLCPGKGNPIGYMSNIEIESFLKNRNIQLNKCQNKEVRQKLECKQCESFCNMEEPVTSGPVELILDNCSKVNSPRKCDRIVKGPRFDTMYDFTNHNDCDLGCQPIWYQRTKRNS